MTRDDLLGAPLRRGATGSKVEELQSLLKTAGAGLHGSPDAKFGPDTEQAVRRFQSTHPPLQVDGVVGSATWHALETATYGWSGKTAPGNGESQTTPVTPAQPTTQPTTTATTVTGDFCFPIAMRPVDWRGGYRYFGANRPHGRKHAACDLYAPLGTHVYAVAEGVLIRDPYPFYLGTWAVEVHHGGLVVRYGEILAGSCHLRAGSHVSIGQSFAQIGRCQGITQPMLHLEIYTHGSDSSGLTVRSAPPYQRRSDVTNPAPYLDRWVTNMPSSRG